MSDPSPPPLLTTDTPCLQCNYNLRSLSANANCPECGLPIATRNPLGAVHARWFTAVSLGIPIFLAAVIFNVVWIALTNVLPTFIKTPLWFYHFIHYTDLPVTIAILALRWWGTQLIAEKQTPNLAQNDTWQRRARLSANAQLVFGLFLSCLTLDGTFHLLGTAYHPIVNFMGKVSFTINAWAGWAFFGLIAEIASFVAKPTLAVVAAWLRWIWPAALLSVAIMTSVAWMVQRFGPSPYEASRIVTFAMGIPNAIVMLIAAIAAFVVMIRVFIWLRRYRPLASPDSHPSRSPWIPEAAARIASALNRLRATASYHGPPPE